MIFSGIRHKGARLFRFMTSFDGRMSRSMFFVCALFVSIFSTIVLGFTLLDVYTAMEAGEKIEISLFSAIIFLIFFPLGLVVTAALFVRRLHDWNMNGWWVILVLMLLPFQWTRYGVMFLCCLVSGDENVNRYGLPPPSFWTARKLRKLEKSWKKDELSTEEYNAAREKLVHLPLSQSAEHDQS